MFERHAQILVAGADALGEHVRGRASIAGSCKRIHEHENAADDVTRDVLVAVRRSFITPFDRSAITALTSSMDDAIDEMWQTAKAITLYEVDELRAADEGDGGPRRRGRAAGRRGGAADAQHRPQRRPAARASPRRSSISKARPTSFTMPGLKALFQAHGEDRPMAFFVGREVYSHLERVLDRLRGRRRRDPGHRDRSRLMDGAARPSPAGRADRRRLAVRFPERPARRRQFDRHRGLDPGAVARSSRSPGPPSSTSSPSSSSASTSPTTIGKGIVDADDRHRLGDLRAP